MKLAIRERKIDKESLKTFELDDAPFVKTDIIKYFLIALLMNLSHERNTGPEFSKIVNSNSNERILLFKSRLFKSAEDLFFY